MKFIFIKIKIKFKFLFSKFRFNFFPIFEIYELILLENENGNHIFSYFAKVSNIAKFFIDKSLYF